MDEFYLTHRRFSEKGENIRPLIFITDNNLKDFLIKENLIMFNEKWNVFKEKTSEINEEVLKLKVFQ